MTSPGRVGRYEIRRVIGRGGMATVYQAYESDLDRDVALKELTLGAGSGREAARRFLREARLAGSFSHPNIVTVHEYFEHGGTPYIAMEYLVRGTLRAVRRAPVAAAGGRRPRRRARRARLRRRARRRPPRSQAREPHGHLAGAREDRRLRDRQARPARRGRPTSRPRGPRSGRRATWPPSVRSGRNSDPWSDLYSVGVIAFELLVGRTPFHDDGGTDGGADAADQRPDPARDLARARRRPGPLGLGRPAAGEGARAAHARRPPRPGRSSTRS